MADIVDVQHRKASQDTSLRVEPTRLEQARGGKAIARPPVAKMVGVLFYGCMY